MAEAAATPASPAPKLLPPPPLRGVEKALLLLVSLDEDVATRMVASLDDRELALLRETTAQMRDVPASSIVRAQREFVEQARTGAPASLVGSDDYLRRLAESAIGSARAAAIFSPKPAVVGDVESPFARIEPTTLAGLLEREHPQTAALVLSQIEASRAALVVSAITPERRREVLLRLGHLEQIGEDVLREVEAEYRVHATSTTASERRVVKGKEVAGTILKRIPVEESASMLDALAEEDAPMADALRQALFTFEDLKRIDGRGMQQLLKEVATDQLVLALRTASEELRQKVFASLSSRAADMLREDLALLGPARISDVEAAQRTICDAALQLERDGRITITREGGGAYV